MGGEDSLEDGALSGRRAIGSAVWIVGAVALAVWIDLGRLHRLHHADSLIPVLTSLYRWTPFFWEQDRFGMLVPLLAIPFRSPLANLLVQDALDVLGWVAAVGLLARFAVGRVRAPLVAAIAIAASLAFEPAAYRFDVLVDQPYGVALALALAGLLLAEPRGTALPSRGRLAGGLLLLGLAHWVALSVAAVVGPLVVLRSVDRAGGRLDAAGRRQLGLVAAAMVLGLVAKHDVVRPATVTGVVSATDWPHGWTLLAAHAWAAIAPARGWGMLAATAGIGIALPMRRGAGAGDARPAVVLFATALAYGLVVATMAHVHASGLHFRYAIPSVLLAEVSRATLAAAALPAWTRTSGRRVTHALAAMVVALAALRAYGTPSVRHVRLDLEEALGSRTADVLASGATHVAGRYWDVWPTVFHANLVLHERGEERVVWGVAFRCRPTRRQWRLAPGGPLRIAVPRGDPEALRVLARYGFVRLAEVERRPTVVILERAASGARRMTWKASAPPAR